MKVLNEVHTLANLQSVCRVKTAPKVTDDYDTLSLLNQHQVLGKPHFKQRLEQLSSQELS
jgi:inhibitor of KinA sporulation pathway (predicted exonuclease)